MSKETDIDCMGNPRVAEALETLYKAFLLMPVAIFFICAIQLMMGKPSQFLLNIGWTWLAASCVLIQEYPKWEPRSLEQILREEAIAEMKLSV